MKTILLDTRDCTEEYQIEFNILEIEYLTKKFDIQLNNDIIGINRSGNGMFDAHFIIKSGNIKDILIPPSKDHEDFTIYINSEDNNLYIDWYHHDGTHTVVYRELKDLSDKQLHNFMYKLLVGTTEKGLRPYTTTLVPYIEHI